MLLKGEIPALITKNSVQSGKGRSSPLIAPSKLSVLEVNFPQFAEGEGCPKLTHSTEVYVPIVFVLGLVDVTP